MAPLIGLLPYWPLVDHEAGCIGVLRDPVESSGSAQGCPPSLSFISPLYLCSHWPFLPPKRPHISSSHHHDGLTSCVWAFERRVEALTLENLLVVDAVAVVFEHVTLCLKGFVKGDAWRAFRLSRIHCIFLSLQNYLNGRPPFKSDVMFFFSLSSATTPPPLLTCSTEVLPHSVFGIHGESVADGGTVNVKNKRGWTAALDLGVFGPELPLHVRWFVTESEASHSGYYWHMFLYFFNWESSEWREL